MLKTLLSTSNLSLLHRYSLMRYPVRHFPRGIYKEQELMRQTKYRIKEGAMEKKIEEIDAR